LAIEYARDDLRRRVTLVIKGEFQVANAAMTLARQREEGAWGYALLADIRGMTTVPTVPVMRGLLSQAAAPGPNGERRGPLAVVATDAIAYRMGCVYSSLGGTQRTVQVFRDYTEALEWLEARKSDSEPGRSGGA
jgi:hypothetical protein